MFGDYLKKKLVTGFLPEVIPQIKPGLKKLAEIGKNYTAKIPLDSGEFVVGLIMLSDGKFVIASCVAKQNEGKNIEIQRTVEHCKADELAELLITNIDKVDFSAVLSNDNTENN